MNSFEILNQFVLDYNLKKSSIKLVKPEINKFYDIYGDKTDLSYDSEVISSILVDLFKLNNENLKMFSEEVISMNFIIGRRHKKIILNYFNYGNNSDLNLFFDELSKDNPQFDLNSKEVLVNYINNLDTNLSSKAHSNFNELWNQAEKDKDSSKLKEYLFGIFSRIHKYYNNDQMTLLELYNYNKPFIKKDLSNESLNKLEDYCSNNTSDDSIHDFYEFYNKLLKLDLQKQSLNNQLNEVMNQKTIDVSLLDNKIIIDRENDINLLPTEEFNAVYFTLNQKVFDKFKNIYDFYDYVLNYLKQIYRVLENNKVFSVEIDNIYYNNKNIKWDIYAYIGVFAERFIRTKETQQFFKPEELCMDMFKFYSINLNENIEEKQFKKALKDYYKGKISIKKVYYMVNTSMSSKDFEIFVKEWQYVYYGFTFNDCYIIRNINDNQLNELNMDNKNHILLIFYKYRIDNRKIPCPVCGGLNISGNSFPEVGHRSWECKNIICSKRSKSNRGKRYSFKTNYMQYNAANVVEKNIISKELISKWRRDIVTIDFQSEIYEMFIKYFSFENEKILFINTDTSSLDISKENDRNSILLSLITEEGYTSKKEKISPIKNLFNDYFKEGKYVNRFLINKNFKLNNEFKLKLDTFMENLSGINLINGDSFIVLNSLNDGNISSAVTSPPYFNAREYSQWPNLYLYLIDMYNIIKASKHVLKDDGIFLYNIGDINGNENTIVKSNMGNKRLLLGPYSILLFKACGFELIDNLIWDKGEPQSKRSTNDGNFTPHYQKPVNVYEHMFIFKKKGENIHLNKEYDGDWNENIIYFSPVIKINVKGENTLGHTAPFPSDIPNFVINKFLNNSDDILLDPFSGSGTSIQSALSNNIKGIGVEISKDYVELSENLIEKENKKVNILY